MLQYKYFYKWCIVHYTMEQKKRKVVQLSVFVYPEQKQLIENCAKKENRSTSNFCKKTLLGAVKD